MFSWLKTKFTGVCLCMLGRGEFAHLVLITKIKATEITCFLPKEQIPKYSFSMHWKCFHALNCSEKSLKCEFHFWRGQKGQAGSRQQKQQLYSPDFLLLISKEQQEPCPPIRAPRASPPAAPSSSGFGEEIKRMWAVPLCPRSHSVTLRLHSSRVPAGENPWHPVRSASQSGWPQKSYRKANSHSDE